VSEIRARASSVIVVLFTSAGVLAGACSPALPSDVAKSPPSPEPESSVAASPMPTSAPDGANGGGAEAPTIPAPPAGSASASAGPPAGVSGSERASEASGGAASAEAVVRRAHPAFNTCYSRGLADDPTIKGHVVLATVLAADGKVEKVSVASNSGLPPKVVACLVTVVRGLRFDPPDHAPTTLNLPITFAKAE
jgi:hypothetical protein